MQMEKAAYAMALLASKSAEKLGYWTKKRIEQNVVYLQKLLKITDQMLDEKRLLIFLILLTEED
jgi:hypothetical protein